LPGAKGKTGFVEVRVQLPARRCGVEDLVYLKCSGFSAAAGQKN